VIIAFLASWELHLRHQISDKSSVGRVSTPEVKATVKCRIAARAPGVVLVEALEMERTRIARELHSGAAQTLTCIKANLELMEALIPDEPELMTRAIGRVGLLADQALSEIRSISRRLYRPDWKRLNLKEGLELVWCTARVPDKFHSKFVVHPMKSTLPDAVRSTIYRAAQEGLANVLRHSGATKIKLEAGERGGRVYLVLEDNGKGWDTREVLRGAKTPFGGIGLRAMREEVLGLNGEFTLTSESGGTCLKITLPIAEN
jgi:two-component system NarL family sensor kinase